MREFSKIFKDGLAKGLRPTQHSPRNQQWLFTAAGAVPEDGVLKALEELPEPVTVDDESYPYPQIFYLKLRTLVCTSKDIYEYEDGTLTQVYFGSVEGTTWSVADLSEYIVLTNGQVVVERNPQDGTYNTYSECAIPVGTCICNLNGQLLVGAPGITVSAGFSGV